MAIKSFDGETYELDLAEPLSRLGGAYSISVTGSSAQQALASTVQRVSVIAVGCAVCVVSGVGDQTATVSDHYIADGERLDFAVAQGSKIAAIAADGASSGTLYVSELIW